MRWLMAIRIIACVSGVILCGLSGGCTASSYVTVKSWGARQPLECIARDNDIWWAVGDNSAVFRPAIYAPYPGRPRFWCLGVRVSPTNPKAVFVEYCPDSAQYIVLVSDDLKVERSKDAFTGVGTFFMVMLAGYYPLEEVPQALEANEELNFVLYPKLKNCNPDQRSTLEKLRPLAERLLLCEDVQ